MVVVAAVSCWLVFSASLALAWAPVDDHVVLVAAAAPAFVLLQVVAVFALAQMLQLAAPLASFLKPPPAAPIG